VLRAGVQELLATAVRAEASELLAGPVHLLEDEGHQRLVRHGFLPEPEVLIGIGKVSVQGSWERDRGVNPFQLITCPALFAQGKVCGGIA
jgi:putative transposase